MPLPPPPPTPRLSVVVPAHDEAELLPATLASLARQSVPGGFEVVVVDNASTDATAAVATAHGARVVVEPRLGVCAARQRGTEAARGEVVVSTDADTTHPDGWLAGLDAALRARPDAVAVAGPCRYVDGPWWATLVPPLFFGAVGALHARTGRLTYLTATNVAFRRKGFPGYDTSLTAGGDEVDLARRLQAWGPVLWEPRHPVLTSSRRMRLGLAHTVLVSWGWHYALNLGRSRLDPARPMAPQPAVRAVDAARSARVRWAWRGVLAALALAAWQRRRIRRRAGSPR